MTRLHGLVLASWLILCFTEGVQTNFETSIDPSELDGDTVLRVPTNGSRQISFTLTYVEDQIVYKTEILYNGAIINVGLNNLEEDGYLHIVQRSCDDSNNPGVTCKLLQITINGVQDLDGAVFNFAVLEGTALRYASGDITVQITDPDDITTTTDSEGDITTATETTTSSPPSQQTTTPVLSPEEQIAQCRGILTLELYVPWAVVGVLMLLQVVTLGILFVVCKRRRRRKDNTQTSGSSGSENSLDKGSLENVRNCEHTSPV